MTPRLRTLPGYRRTADASQLACRESGRAGYRHVHPSAISSPIAMRGGHAHRHTGMTEGAHHYTYTQTHSLEVDEPRSVGWVSPLPFWDSLRDSRTERPSNGRLGGRGGARAHPARVQCRARTSARGPGGGAPGAGRGGQGHAPVRTPPPPPTAPGSPPSGRSEAVCAVAHNPKQRPSAKTENAQLGKHNGKP